MSYCLRKQLTFFTIVFTNAKRHHSAFFYVPPPQPSPAGGGSEGTAVGEKAFQLLFPTGGGGKMLGAGGRLSQPRQQLRCVLVRAVGVQRVPVEGCATAEQLAAAGFA